MAAVDYERAWVALKARLGQRRSWGADQLHVTMNEIEVECVVPGEEGFDMTPQRPAQSHGSSNVADPPPSGRTTTQDGATDRPATPAAA